MAVIPLMPPWSGTAGPTAKSGFWLRDSANGDVPPGAVQLKTTEFVPESFVTVRTGAAGTGVVGGELSPRVRGTLSKERRRAMTATDSQPFVRGPTLHFRNCSRSLFISPLLRAFEATLAFRNDSTSDFELLLTQYSVNNEFPVRAGTFFYNNAPGSASWFDFGAGGVFSQLNLGVTVGNCLVPLGVDVAPNTASACVGSGVALTASASGSPPHTYQWTEDGVDIPGATSSTYTATKATAGSHTYNCRVTDAGGCHATQDATASTATWEASTVPPETAAGPGPANELVWSTPHDLVWPTNPNAVTYTLYRGVRADLPQLLDSAVDSCTRYQGATAMATGLTEEPLAGDFYWYVVTGTSVCAIESPAGSSRVVNSSGACP